MLKIDNPFNTIRDISLIGLTKCGFTAVFGHRLEIKDKMELNKKNEDTSRKLVPTFSLISRFSIWENKNFFTS